MVAAQKWFPLKISSVNVTKSAVFCGFGLLKTFLMNNFILCAVLDNGATSRDLNLVLSAKKKDIKVRRAGLTWSHLSGLMVNFKHLNTEQKMKFSIKNFFSKCANNSEEKDNEA